MFALLLLFPLVTGVFYGDNKEFFDQAAKERAMGAEWHYVGKQALNPTAKSIPAQICDPDTGECGEPYIIWKLKMPEENGTDWRIFDVLCNEGTFWAWRLRFRKVQG